MRAQIAASILALLPWALSAQTQETVLQSSFHVRYVAPDAVYIDAGRNAGLAEGVMLVIKPASVAKAEAEDTKAEAEAKPHKEESAGDEDFAATAAAPVAELRVVSVAETSAVCEVLSSKRPVVAGDIVSLPSDEVAKLVAKRSLSSTRQYPMVVSFTEGDPLDEEVRESQPRPPLPEVNQASGRFGLDYSSTWGSGTNSSQLGFVVRTDILRIGGTHWNLVGYWRGEVSRSSAPAVASTQDLVNHTYQFGLTYSNPRKPWLLGAGRLYLPWASSLGVIDGIYAGRKLSRVVTAGAFVGLQQDPTSWNYNPNRRVGGTFLNFDGGDYDALKYSSTFGYGMNTIGWQIQRPFFFSENVVSYHHLISVYHAMQVDSPTPGPGQPAAGVGVGDSYFSFRVEPRRGLAFDFNDTYYRDVPTYNPQLIGTGLLDKLLFQGVSGGVRVEVPMHITLFTDIGRSSNSKDPKSSWNTIYGISFGRIWRTGIHADLRYAHFDSPFAQGSYEAIILTRNFNDSLRLNLQIGKQSYTTTNSTDTGSKFVNLMLDSNVGRRFFVETGVNVQRGSLQYTQFMTTFGCRFDNRHKFSGGMHAK